VCGVVTKVSQKCHSGVTVVLQKCYSGVRASSPGPQHALCASTPRTNRKAMKSNYKTKFKFLILHVHYRKDCSEGVKERRQGGQGRQGGLYLLGQLRRQ
jgi:hypothetical protein